MCFPEKNTADSTSVSCPGFSSLVIKKENIIFHAKRIKTVQQLQQTLFTGHFTMLLLV